MDALVSDLDREVSRLAPEGGRVALVGESFGGALTLSYALAHPERVERLVDSQFLRAFRVAGAPLARLPPVARHAVAADADRADAEREPDALGENRAG